MTMTTLTKEERRLTRRFAKPEHHLGRLAEVRTPQEQSMLLAIDRVVASYGMSADELRYLLHFLRSKYRNPDNEFSKKQFRFLDDLARSIDDLAIDAQHRDDERH